MEVKFIIFIKKLAANGLFLVTSTIVPAYTYTHTHNEKDEKLVKEKYGGQIG